uniref:Ig-like domain-containing protein n=1 Tax=Panthera leo TaxID=9689 RepID=A0A8C8X4Q4_PANLE
EMLLPLLLPLLWAGEWVEGSLQENPGYKLQVQKSVTVQEGLCVRVPCTVSYPGVRRSPSAPVYGSWFRKTYNPKGDVLMATNKPAKGAKRKNRFSFHLAGDPGDRDCSLNITDAQKGDSGKYYFQLDTGSMRRSYQSDLLTVTVRALTQTPDIRIEEPLASGSPSHLTCSVPGVCDGVTPLTLSWTGAALGPLGLDLEAYNSSELLLTPRPQDHGTNLTCHVTFPRAGVSTQSTITLNVSYAPQNLTIGISRGNCTELKYPGNGSSLPVLEGESVLLVCVADSNPPATLSWAQGSQTLSPSQPWKPGVLELPRVELGHEGEFTCRAQHALGSQHVSLRLSVVCECGDPRGGGAGRAGLHLLRPCPAGPHPALEAGGGADRSSTPLDHPPPAMAAPSSEEEKEPYYASLTFHGLKPWNLPDPEATSTTEYSEIKICK